MIITPFNLLVTLGATIGIFLVGVNVAFLMNLGNSLVTWFKFKILAVTGMLVYISLSLVLGDPDLWRAVIGIGAMTVDLVAVFWMWNSIIRLADSGVLGLVPLIAIKPEEKPQPSR